MKYIVIEPNSELKSILPDWIKVVKIVSGELSGFHALWNVDGKKERQPWIELPNGAKNIEIKKTDMVADMGAYVGAFAYLCSVRQASKVVAYEPTKLSCMVLNLSSRPNLEIHNAAVTAKGGDVDFNVGTSGLGLTNSIFSFPRNPRVEKIRSVPFSEAVEGKTVIKIDVEGAEYEYPMFPLPSSVHTVFMSLHKRPDIDWETKANSIVGNLQNEGFKSFKPPKIGKKSSPWQMESVWAR